MLIIVIFPFFFFFFGGGLLKRFHNLMALDFDAKVDHIVNNAGTGRIGKFEDIKQISDHHLAMVNSSSLIYTKILPQHQIFSVALCTFLIF